MMVSYGPTTQKCLITMVVFVVVARTINKDTCKKQLWCLLLTALSTFPVFDHECPQGVRRPWAPCPLVAHPRPPHCALVLPTSSSTALHLRSCAEQRQRLSLANLICSNGIVILRGSKSSCAGRGHATKMQSIGCQLGVECFKSCFHLKLVVESQTWILCYVFSSRSGNEPLYNNLTRMLPNEVQVRWTQNMAHPNGYIDILFLGLKYEEMSFLHIVGNAENMYRAKVRGPYILVVWLVLIAKFSSITTRNCSPNQHKIN